MTKDQLITEIVEQSKVASNITPEQTKEVLTLALSIIIESVACGQVVTLRGFGTFGPKNRAEKKARNIGTGEAVLIPAHVIPAFKPAPAFRTAVLGTCKP